MKTQIKILGAIYIGLSVILGLFILMGLLKFALGSGGNYNYSAVIVPLLILLFWFWRTGSGLWKFNLNAWLPGLITGGVLMLLLHSLLLFGDGGKYAKSAGQKVVHIVCIAIGFYTVVILLLPRGQAIFHPKLSQSSDENFSPPEIAAEKEPEQAGLYASRKMVFEEKMSPQNKLYLIGVVVFVVAIAALMSFSQGQVGIIVFGLVVVMITGLISVFGYVSFSGTQIVCDDEGFQVNEIGGQQRRIRSVQYGSVGLFVISLIVLVIVINFSPSGPPPTLNLILALGSCVGIVLGIAGFLLGKNMDLTLNEKAGKRRFGWWQITDMQIFPVDENDNFIFSVRVDNSEVLSYPSAARGFRNLLRVFNENATHLPFLWVDEETINRREIVENVGEYYFKILRRES